MTAFRDLKRIIRERQLKTGESYTAARAHVLRERAELLGLAPRKSPTAAPERVEAVVLKVNRQSARVAIYRGYLEADGVLGMLAAALVWFVSKKLHYFADYSLRSYSDYYWPRRSGLLLHLTGGMLAISTGLFQIWLGLTNRVHTLHRLLGKVYGAGVLLGSLGGFYMALTIPDHLAYRTGLIGLNVAWIITTGMALYAISLRRIEQHREWMLRSYTVTFAFITFRLGEQILRHWVTLPDDPVADDLDTVMAWASWAIPLLFAEPLIQMPSMRRRARAAAH